MLLTYNRMVQSQLYLLYCVSDSSAKVRLKLSASRARQEEVISIYEATVSHYLFSLSYIDGKTFHIELCQGVSLCFFSILSRDGLQTTDPAPCPSD